MTDPGYSITDGVLSNAECDDLIDSLTDLGQRRGRAGARHLMSHADIRDLASDSRLLNLAEKSLGRKVVPYRATLFEKSGKANWLVVWHQDTALPLQSKIESEEWGPWSTKTGALYAHAPSWALDRVVALRVHLDASTEDNGPLRIIPETHKLGVLTDGEIFSLARQLQSAQCIVKRGGVMAMRPLLIHSSSKAKVDSYRRVLHIEYADCLEFNPGVQLAVT
ncbi:MAG TPA: phytanoyl-CoA dioxygenase family protein [Blastocatellia bacterium]|nr:phytanoyl-CoA dioxygenase family protein [Blastocatellia bacterium]